MDSKIGINLKKYFLYSLPSTGFCVFFTRSPEEIFAIILALILTFVNQYLLVLGVSELLNPAYLEDSAQRPTKKIIFFFILKMLILALALYFCAVIMGKRVIIPIINYVILIFVLYFSLEKKVRK